MDGGAIERALPDRARAAARRADRAIGARRRSRRRAAARRGSATSSRGRPASRVADQRDGWPASAGYAPGKAHQPKQRRERGRQPADAGARAHQQQGSRRREQQQRRPRTGARRLPDRGGEDAPNPDRARQRAGPRRRMRHGRACALPRRSGHDGRRGPHGGRRGRIQRAGTGRRATRRRRSRTVWRSVGAGAWAGAAVADRSVASAHDGSGRSRAVLAASGPRPRVGSSASARSRAARSSCRVPRRAGSIARAVSRASRQRARKVGAASGKRGQRPADAPRGRGRGGPAHRVDAGQPLVQDQRQRVEVGGLTDLQAFALLGRHVGERAERLAGARERVFARRGWRRRSQSAWPAPHARRDRGGRARSGA